MHHANQVGILDGAQAVRNDQRGTVAHEVIEGLLHKVFALGVKGRGGLVENEDGRILENGARYADALPLTARQVAAAVAYVGVKLLFGGHDKVVGIGNLSRLDYFLLRGILHTEGDVVIETVVKQNSLLVHIAHEGAQVVLGHLTDVDAVDADAALVHIVEARQQVGQRGLARAALPHERHRLALRYGERHVVNHAFLAIAKLHILVGDALLDASERSGVLGVFEVILGHENLVDALHRGESFLHRVARPRELLGWIDDVVENHHIIYKGGRGDRRLAAQNERAAKPQHNGDGGGAQKLAHGVRQLVAALHAARDVAVFLVLLREAALHLVLGIEGLDDAQSANGLLDVAQQRAPLVLPIERHAFQALAHGAHDEPGNGQQHKHKQGELPAHNHHHRQAHDNHDGILEHHVERRHDAVLHLGHIAAHARHHIALALVAEETDGQAHNPVVDLVAYVAHHAGANGNHIVGGQICAARLQGGHHHQRTGYHSERRGVAIALNDALHHIVEVVHNHILHRARAPCHKLIVLLVDAKQHLQNGNDERKREQREKCRQNVEQHIQHQVLLVGRHKSPQYREKSFKHGHMMNNDPQS